jgi:phage tail-like protein
VAGTRTTPVGRFALQLDGVTCGFVHAVSGGGITADVVTAPARGAGFDEKHLGPVRYEEIAVQLDLSCDARLYDWIAATLKRSFSRKNGSIVTTDAAGKAVSEQEFVRGLVSEVGFPALDGSSKEAAYLTVKIAPELTRLKKGSGKPLKAAPGLKPKLWQASKFKLEIDGLETKRVSKVDPLTIRQSSVRDTVGDTRRTVKEPGNVEFPNLRVTFPQIDADTWTAWFEDFVVKGNNGSSQERGGTLTFLTADAKTRLGALSFFKLGIFRLEPEARQAGSDAVARLVADLYCERMELTVP